MICLWPTYLKAWKKEYLYHGRLWGGGHASLPDLPRGSYVLELGCGNGKILSSLARHPLRVIALDVCLETMAFCRQFAASSPSLDLLTADACKLPIKDGIFDCIFAFHIVGHVPLMQRQELASEAARVLNNGGILIFRGFGVEDMRFGKGEEVEPQTFKRNQGIITHYFTEEEVVRLFGKMMPLFVETHRWKMNVRGKELHRSEVRAIFKKI